MKAIVEYGPDAVIHPAAYTAVDKAEADACIYHATNEGFVSWAEFAKAIFARAGIDCAVHPVPSSEYKTAAQRPMNSRMSKRSLDEAGFGRLPTWQDALGRFLQELADN